MHAANLHICIVSVRRSLARNASWMGVRTYCMVCREQLCECPSVRNLHLVLSAIQLSDEEGLSGMMLRDRPADRPVSISLPARPPYLPSCVQHNGDDLDINGLLKKKTR